MNRTSRLVVTTLLYSSLVILHSSLLFGCAVPHIPARTVYETPTDFVRLEPDPQAFHEIPQTLHDHPAAISVQDMITVLKGFSAREHRNAIQRWFFGPAVLEPVFRDEEIAWLAPRLAEALETARPDERATFYISYPETSIKREITSGGAYVQGGRLHFMLGNYRVIYGIPAYGMVYDRRYPISPTAPKAFDLVFDPPTAIIKHPTTWWEYVSGRKKDEVVIDLQRVRAQEPAA
ncbi:hypothetical protein [Candidatus Nitrospira bockiana]